MVRAHALARVGRRLRASRQARGRVARRRRALGLGLAPGRAGTGGRAGPALRAAAGQTLAVEDERMPGTQSVSFAAPEEGTRIALALAYELKSGAALKALVDLLFIRRAMGDSLRRTLARFRPELEADATSSASFPGTRRRLHGRRIVSLRKGNVRLQSRRRRRRHDGRGDRAGDRRRRHPRGAQGRRPEVR